MAEIKGFDDSLMYDSTVEIFKKYLEENGIKNPKIEIMPGSVKGDNYLGLIAKAVVTAKDSNGKDFKDSFIIKSATKSEGLRKYAPIALAFEREMFIYKHVLPTFKKFQEEKQLKKPFESYAEYLKSTCEHKEEALIMKDMKERGFVMQNRKNALDFNHCKLVLTELARLHAISFALRDQKPEVFEKLASNMTKHYFLEMDLTNFEQYSTSQCDHITEFLNPETDSKALEKFNEFRKHYIYNCTEIFNELCHPYTVIRHGDCWTNNMLFKYEDKSNPKTPTSLCFLDWQISHVGPPVFDIFYFMYATSDKKLREHYDELINHYYQTLKEFTTELGSDIDKLYPYSIYQEQLLRFGRYGLTAAILLLKALLSDSDEVPDINTVFDENEDPATMMEKFSLKSRNDDKYGERIRDIIYHVIDKEYI